MLPLHEDQIHAPAFQKISDFIWGEEGRCDYELSVIREHNPKLKMVNASNFPKEGKGVLFIGMCHLIEEIFQVLPKTGEWIIIHRTNDRSFTKAMYNKKPESVKHIYTVDCQVHELDVSAIPFGVSSILGEDEIIKPIISEPVEPAKTKIFCRYNVNPGTLHRNESLPILRTKPFVKLIEEQIPVDQFYRECKAHKFTMALAGCGMDASRQWSAILLGSIPIVTDCIEMRHFEDLPMIYCPHNMNDITEEWLSAMSIGTGITEKNTMRMRMSYWKKHLENKKRELKW